MVAEDELSGGNTAEVALPMAPVLPEAEATGDDVTDERFDFGLFLTAVQDLSVEEGPIKALQRLFNLESLDQVSARERLTEILKALTAVPWFRPLLNSLRHELREKLKGNQSVEEAVKTLSIDVNLPDGAVFLIDLSWYTLFTSNTPDLSQQKVLFDEFSKTMLEVCAKYEAYAMQPPPGDCWIVVVHPRPGQSAEEWKARREQCFFDLHQAANRVEMPNAELVKAHPDKFPMFDGKPRFQAKALARTFTRGELQILGLTGPDGLQGIFAAGGSALDELKKLEKGTFDGRKIGKNEARRDEYFSADIKPTDAEDSDLDVNAFVSDTVREPRLALALSAALIQMMPRGSFSTWTDEKLHQDVEGDSKVESAQNTPGTAVIVLKIPQNPIPAEFFKGLLALRAEHPKFNMLKPDGDKQILYCNNYGEVGGVSLPELMNFLAGLRNLLKENQIPVQGYVASGDSFVVMPLAKGEMPAYEYSSVALIKGARYCAAGQSEGFAIDASIALRDTRLGTQELDTTVAPGMSDLQFLKIREEGLGAGSVDGAYMVNILETHGGRELIGREAELAKILGIAACPGKPLSLCLASGAPGVGVSALTRRIPNAHLITQKKGSHPLGAVAALIEKVESGLPHATYEEVRNSSQILLTQLGSYFGAGRKPCIVLDLPRYTEEERRFFTLFRNAAAGLGSVTIFHNDALLFETQELDVPQKLEVQPFSTEDAARYILECRTEDPIPEHLRPRVANILEHMSRDLKERVPFVPRNLRKVANAMRMDGANLVLDDVQLRASMVSGGQLVAKAMAEGISVTDQTILSVIGAVGVPMVQDKLVAVLQAVTGFENSMIRAAIHALRSIPKGSSFLEFVSANEVALRDPDMAFAMRGMTSFSVEQPEKERLLAQAVVAQVQSSGFPVVTDSNGALVMALLDHLYKSGDALHAEQIKNYVQHVGVQFYKKGDLSAAMQVYDRYLKWGGGLEAIVSKPSLDFCLEMAEIYRQSSHGPHRSLALQIFNVVGAHCDASTKQKLRSLWGESRLHGVKAVLNFGELNHSEQELALINGFKKSEDESLVRQSADRSAYSLVLRKRAEMIDPECPVSLKGALQLMSLIDRGVFLDPHGRGGCVTEAYKAEARPKIQAELDECVEKADLEAWLDDGVPSVVVPSDLPYVGTALRLACNAYNILGDSEKAARYGIAAETIFAELSPPDFKQELDSMNNRLFSEAYRLFGNAATTPLPEYFSSLEALKISSLELERKSLLAGDIASQYAALVLQYNVCDLALIACLHQNEAYLDLAVADTFYIEGSDLVRRMNLLAPLCRKSLGNQAHLDAHLEKYKVLFQMSSRIAAK